MLAFLQLGNHVPSADSADAERFALSGEGRNIGGRNIGGGNSGTHSHAQSAHAHSDPVDGDPADGDPADGDPKDGDPADVDPGDDDDDDDDLSKYDLFADADPERDGTDLDESFVISATAPAHTTGCVASFPAPGTRVRACYRAGSSWQFARVVSGDPIERMLRVVFEGYHDIVALPKERWRDETSENVPDGPPVPKRVRRDK